MNKISNFYAFLKTLAKTFKYVVALDQITT